MSLNGLPDKAYLPTSLHAMAPVHRRSWCPKTSTFNRGYLQVPLSLCSSDRWNAGWLYNYVLLVSRFKNHFHIYEPLRRLLMSVMATESVTMSQTIAITILFLFFFSFCPL